MAYEFLTEYKSNHFYSLSESELEEAQKDLEIPFPKELVKLYKEIGYGFLKGDSGNINRLMDPLSVRDFRLQQNDFEFFPDIELYAELKDELVFFEVNETVLITIKLSDSDINPIFYDEFKIADSLKEFLTKITEDDIYYMELIY